MARAHKQASMTLGDGVTHFRLIPALSLGSALHTLLPSGPRLHRAVMGKPPPPHGWCQADPPSMSLALTQDRGIPKALHNLGVRVE